MTETPGSGETSSGMKGPQGREPIRLAGRILVADDVIVNQRFIATFLGKAGATVDTVGDGRAAVDRIMTAFREGHPYDLVLMDMQMPEMDGFEATTSLRRSGYGGPILALTAHSHATEQERCKAAGCDGHLSKPVDRDRLLKVAAKYLDRRE